MQEALSLSHNDPNCTGSWHRHWLGRLTAYWRCWKCLAVYYDSREVQAAVRTEIRMGRLLRRYEKQGRRML